MKNFFKITGIVLLVLFAASCSNGLLNTTYTGIKDNGKCLVSFNVTNFANSRTILPDALKIEDIDHFTIEGKSNKGEVLPETEVTIDATGEGKVTLSYSLWKLTLKAYDANDQLLLQGTSTPDLTNGAAAILFTLTEKDVTTPGSVKLSGTFEDQYNLIDTVVCGVYNITTGIAVDEKETTGVTDKEFSYEQTDLPPGEYVFKVILKKGTEEYAVWSDVVKVAPGLETLTDDILITQDIIGTKPEKPANLMAYLIDDSENDDGTYKVKLTWEDKSSNESKFVVTLKEYNADGTEDATVTPKTFDILASTETTTLELKLGKLYDVSIAAVNRINKDNFEDDKLERVAATGNANDPNDASYTTTAITSTRINRFKIEYILDGGKYITSATESQTGGVLVDYHTYSETTPVTLKTINEYDETSPTYPTLIKGNFPFVKWITANDTTSTEVTSYDGFTNYSVKAVYNKDSVINVEIPGYKTLDASRILCTYGETTDATQTTCFDGTTSTPIDGTTGQVLTLTIAEATDDQPVFDEYKILVQGNIVYTGSSNVAKAFTNTKDYESGTYILTACAKDSETGIWYSYTFGITIQR